jgi:hypothetical protein
MFQPEIIESLLMIAVISAVIVWYGVVAGRNEDREAKSLNTIKFDSSRHKKTA